MINSKLVLERYGTKSGEFEIKQGVVSALLRDGFPREKIRLEIPLDTNSSDGRADIVLLGDEMLAALELKSAKDKFCEKAIAVQTEKYKRCFDVVKTVIDKQHWRKLEIRSHTEGWTRHECNFRNVDFIYSHFYGQIKRDADDEKGIHGFPACIFSQRSRRTTALDMAGILWASEIKNIFGISTKSKFISIVREEKALREIRPAVLKALAERPLNEWESAFWEKFTPLELEALNEKT